MRPLEIIVLEGPARIGALSIALFDPETARALSSRSVVPTATSFLSVRFGPLDFSMSAPMIVAVIACFAFPPCLAIVARVPSLHGRRGLQFAIDAGVTSAGWTAATVATGEPALTAGDVAVGAMLLISGLILYLELWALLSRGYSLGIILTLLRAPAPLDDVAIARGYRAGDGLSWIMRHRLAGLEAAGLVTARDGVIGLTPWVGAPIARIYVAAVALLGLPRSG
jgi:hypothetical protein